MHCFDIVICTEKLLNFNFIEIDLDNILKCAACAVFVNNIRWAVTQWSLTKHRDYIIVALAAAALVGLVIQNVEFFLETGQNLFHNSYYYILDEIDKTRIVSYGSIKGMRSATFGSRHTVRFSSKPVLHDILSVYFIANYATAYESWVMSFKTSYFPQNLFASATANHIFIRFGLRNCCLPDRLDTGHTC